MSELSDWVEFGLDPELFWTTPPREMQAIIVGKQRSAIKQQNQFAWLAWHIAALGRKERLPRLDRLQMKYRKPVRRMDWRTQMSVMDQWVAVTTPQRKKD